MLIYRQIANKVKNLDMRLMQARVVDTPEQYVKKILFTAFYMSIGLILILFTFFQNAAIVLLFPVIFLIAFVYFLRFVDFKTKKIEKGISREIVFAGNFMIIEIESGVPLYNAFENISKNYEFIGMYFGEIVEKVDLGTGMEDAINETIEMTPSMDLKRMLWQIINSLKTGANISKSLTQVIDQIVREQQIAVSEYSRKLNPLAMFYMMIAIIVPSLGITMLIILATFIGFKLTMTWLFVLVGFIGFVQFMFLTIIRAQRPAVDIEGQ